MSSEQSAVNTEKKKGFFDRRTPFESLGIITDKPAVRIIRGVPDEEAVAIILRAAKENPF